MIESIYLKFGKVSVFDNFIIVEMKEGVNISPEDNIYLTEIAEKRFSNKYFGYISYRHNSYSVNPMIYLKTSEIENLVAFAVVSPLDGITQQNIMLEKHFLKKPFEHFGNLDDAKNWIYKIIKNLNLKESEP